MNSNLLADITVLAYNSLYLNYYCVLYNISLDYCHLIG